MKHSCYFTWLPIAMLVLLVSTITPVIQAEEGNNGTSSEVSVLDNPLMDAKIKRLGDPLRVQYTFKTHKKSESYDVYIAHSAGNSTQEGLQFILPSGEFPPNPLPYYTKIAGDKEEIVLDFTLPTDKLELVGEHFFYAAILKAGTDVSGLAPAEWPWEQLSSDSVFVSR